MRLLGLAVLIAVAMLVMIPQRAEGQGADDSLAERHRLMQLAQEAFDREIAREKTGDCKSASTTGDQVTCLDKEMKISEANYKTFTSALRKALPSSGVDASDSRKLVQEFDRVEGLWSEYRKQMCVAAYDQNKGGTIAPVNEGLCHQSILRNHMRELRDVYEGLWR